jgi:hypothetical protein
MTPKTDLSARKQSFVAAMAAGMTQEEAAQTIGVRARTCRRYQAEPLVRAAIQRAQDDALGEVTRRMNAVSNAALDVLQEVMTDNTAPAGVRIRAAQIWMDAALKAREMLDMASRLTELEERLGTGK